MSLTSEAAVERNKAPYRGAYFRGGASAKDAARDALRDVAAELAQLGVRDPNHCLRLAAAAVGERVAEALRADPRKRPAWAEVVLADGGSRLGRRETASDLLRELEWCRVQRAEVIEGTVA